MFGKKKSAPNSSDPTRSRKGADLMNQMGLGSMTGMPDIDAMVYGADDDDDDLEAELAELAGEDYKPTKAKAKRKAPMPMVDIEKMAAAGMEDLNEEDVSDTEDPSLLLCPYHQVQYRVSSWTKVRCTALLMKRAELEDLQEEEDDEPPPPQKPSPSHNQPPTKPSPSKSVSPPGTLMYQPTTSAPAPSQRQSPAPSRASPSPASTPTSAARPSGSGGLPGLLEERLNMYRQASANAKAAGDSSKQRRLDRGTKTLTSLLRQAKAGKPVDEEEIPPPVAMGTRTDTNVRSPVTEDSGTPSSQPSREPEPRLSNSAPSPTSSTSGSAKQLLLERREQYKKSAFMAKQAGDMSKAGSYVKIARQFDAVIQAIEQGQPVDLSKMPPPPPEVSGKLATMSKNVPSTSVPVQRSSNQAAGSQETKEPDTRFPDVSENDVKSLFNAPDAPKTVMDALTQRLAKYQGTADEAKQKGEGSKARRMGRIVKQYEDAIKSYKAGRPVDFDELPTPPGFAPIPVNAAPPAQPQRSQAPAGPASAAAAAPTPRSPPSTSSSASSKPESAAPQAAQRAAPPAAAARQPVQRQNTAKKITTRAGQQLAFLRERLGEFKQAAIAAKKNHDIELAKKYVRIMKGIEPMIDAVEGGLPVDLSQVPESPYNAEENENKFVIVNEEDCEPTGDREEVFKNLQTDLLKQIQICVTNSQHYQKLGDVPAAAKFEKLEQGCRKDLESLKSALRHGDPAPRFHYEVRSFSMVRSNTDLGDADLEMEIVRGIQYNLPSGYSEKDMDTCVKYEMAYPTDDPQTGSTGTVKDTVNPEYKESFKLQINRTSKGFSRFIERKALKFEIFIKRGFFKGDKLLGTVNVKLNALERQCTLHESYDLMDGRKSAGGKLEVKIRIRDPFKSKQVDEVKEKWLVIDQFIRTVGSKSHVESKAPKTDSGGTTCMEVLRLEKQLLDKQIAQLKDSLSVTQTHALKHKSCLIQEKIELQQKKLREGGVEAWKAYMVAVSKEIVGFEQEARQYVRLGEVQKAELLMTKRKQAEKELAAIKARMPAS